MNPCHHFTKTIATGLVVAMLAAAHLCQGAVLNVPQRYQEKNQWCWCASSQMVLLFKGYSYSQAAIAKWAVGGKNVANYLYGSDSSRRGADLILKHFGKLDTQSHAAALSLSSLQTEIAQSRPVLIRWGWDGGGGHMLVIRGIANKSVYLNDPWPDNGPSVNTYNWVCKAGGHTWTHTLTLKASAAEANYTRYRQNYNQAMSYLSYYQKTGSYYYLYNAYLYYAYANYYYYLYHGNSSLATQAYQYYAKYAKHYYDLYTYATNFAYYYKLANYYYDNARTYRHLAYAYHYYGYALWCYYMYYGYTSYANYYYNYYLQWAYYFLYR